ncbi:hypothetical protein JCM10212_002381 [Sporobolomyces blumeae]
MKASSFAVVATLVVSSALAQVAPKPDFTRFKLAKRSDPISTSGSASDSSLAASSSSFPSSSLAVAYPSSSSVASSSHAQPSSDASWLAGSLSSAATASTPTTTGIESTTLLSVDTATSLVAPPATGSSAAPAPPTTNSSAEVVVVLQIAFLLEVLEFEFYKSGLSKFGVDHFVAAGYSHEQAAIIVETLETIVINEGNHVVIIEETILALGGQPFKGCGFALNAALADPLTFLSTARTLETVGVAAYAGAAHLIADPQILTAAATILSIESRHSSLLNMLTGGEDVPQSFDLALTVESVLALAGGFLQGCTPSDVGFAANEPLSVVEGQFGSTRFETGSLLVLEVSIEIDITVLFCQMIVGGQPAAYVFPAQSCYVPPGINGPVLVYLTNTSTPLATNILVQNSVQIVAGPGLIFVDSQTTLLSSLFPPTAPSGAHSLYSVDLGGYWIAKRKGGSDWAKVQLVKGVHPSKRAVEGGSSTSPSSKRAAARRKSRRGHLAQNYRG